MSNFGLGYIEEVVGFVIFVGLIWWKLVPVLKSLTNKKATLIKEQLSATENAQKAATASIEAAKASLEKAKADAIQIVADAHKSAENIIEHAKERAAQERGRIASKVDQDIDFELNKVRDAMTKEFAETVVAAARLLVEKHLDQKLHHAVIADAIQAASASTHAEVR
ncbi:MAG: hypothetical protein M1374_02470 [Firmicutes bacterium]|nr:hypothetical protein [Bacillota bacterium]